MNRLNFVFILPRLLGGGGGAQLHENELNLFSFDMEKNKNIYIEREKDITFLSAY